MSDQRSGFEIRGYLVAIAIATLATVIGFFLDKYIEPTNLVMVYLAGVAFVASKYRRMEAAFCSIISVLAFDFLFIPPRLTFAVEHSPYIITFVVMLGVGLLISDLTLHVRLQADASAERERRTTALYALSREMSQSRNKREIAAAAANKIRDVFDADTVVFVGDELVVPSRSGFELDPPESGAAIRSLTDHEMIGKGTETLPESQGLYLPLIGTRGALGVLGILPNAERWPLSPAQFNLLETFVNGLGLAIERTVLAKESQDAKLDAETERLRNALLSSISHDLRTPLTAIAGAASSLKEGHGDVHGLADTIYQESIRLNVQVQNLLDMTRLQSGEVQARMDWNSLEELVGNALAATRELIAGREVTVNIPAASPLVLCDGILIQKVIVNLIENASSHTPAGTPILISVDEMREYTRLNVADRGQGIPKAELNRIFDRFFQSDGSGGFGLGLAISRAIMKLHKGRIWAENRSDGTGAVFHLEFVKLEEPPQVPLG